MPKVLKIHTNQLQFYFHHAYNLPLHQQGLNKSAEVTGNTPSNQCCVKQHMLNKITNTLISSISYNNKLRMGSDCDDDTQKTPQCQFAHKPSP